MKLFYRLILKYQPQGQEELFRDVAIWNDKLREIIWVGNYQTARVPTSVIESLLACQDEDRMCRSMADFG